mmetsp:Transcript_30240/g.69541  ORF Transcript_30240/g.69541 Transcript_30240/m.69541 type:complete len:212 (+) Transcript_30240:5771-6406(+)
MVFISIAPKVSCPNSISSSKNSMFGTTAVATTGTRIGLPPRMLSVSMLSSCVGLSRNMCTFKSMRPSGEIRPRIGVTVTPSMTLSTWYTANVLPLLITGTVRSHGKPTASTPKSTRFVPNAQLASCAEPVHLKVCSSPSSIFNVSRFSINAPLFGGVKTTSMEHAAPARITPAAGLTAKEAFIPFQLNLAGALPGFVKVSCSVRVLSRLSS